MEEFLQLYICHYCGSIKTVFGEAETWEKFQKTLPEEIPCRVNDCMYNALPKEKICTAEGHVHGYMYFKDAETGKIFCAKHREKPEPVKWIPIRNDNIFDSIKDKDDPTRRENW